MIIHRGKQQDGRQKPRQWGPLSAVRDAVRHNCERLGLPVPRAIWFMGEKNGPTVYDIINGHHGTLNGVSWSVSGLEYLTGSNSRHVNLGARLNDFDVNQPFSLFARITTTTTAYGYIFGTQESNAGTARGVQIGTMNRTNNEAIVRFQGNNRKQRTNSRVINDGNPHTILASYTGANDGSTSELRLFVDGFEGYTTGSQDNEFSVVDSVTTSVAARLGNRIGDGIPFYGGMSIVAIFNDALTLEQAQILHAQPYAMLEPIPRLRVFQADEGFVLVSPADTTSGLTLPLTLTWADVGATQYQVQVAATADTDFASPVVDELVATNSYEITSLAAGWYRWRVRYRM